MLPPVDHAAAVIVLAEKFHSSVVAETAVVVPFAKNAEELGPDAE